MLIVACNTTTAQQYLISGCKSDKAAVIDRSGKVLWQVAVEGADSNDSQITNDGNILIAYKYGAKLISRDKQVLWDYKVTFPQEDLNTATQLPNGNYLIAYCAHPAHIIELDQEGNVISDLEYETGVKRVHQQFRQVTKSREGTYIIPIMGLGVIREITTKGELLREIKVGGTPFSVTPLRNKNWLVAGGDGHYIMEINPDNEEVIDKISQNDLDFCKLLFVASTHRLKGGRTLFVNWGGHAKGSSEPSILEIDKKRRATWILKDIEGFVEVSSIDIIEKKFEF